MHRSSLLFGLITLSFIFFENCGEVTLQQQYDAAAQKAIDRTAIQKYIDDNQLGIPDTTASGARYFIFNTGDGDSIKAGDLVFIEMAEYDVDTTNVNTNVRTAIPEITEIRADTIFRSRQVSAEPSVFTYSESGWTLDFIYPISNSDQQLLAFNNKWLALKEAIIGSFPKMKVGGHVQVILPSTEAYGPRLTIFPANAVMCYKIYIIDVK